MIDKLLITCLQRGKRLIIPELGAFLKKNVEGVGVTLVFVPFLNKDDGILTAAVQQWAGVDESDAKEIVEQYVKHIKHALEARGQYIVEGLGVLKYDANGVLYLTKGGSASAQTPTVGTPLTSSTAAASSVASATSSATTPAAAASVVSQPVVEASQQQQQMPSQSHAQESDSPVDPVSLPNTANAGRSQEGAFVAAPAPETPTHRPTPAAASFSSEQPVSPEPKTATEPVAHPVVAAAKAPVERVVERATHHQQSASTSEDADERSVPRAAVNAKEIGTRYFTPQQNAPAQVETADQSELVENGQPPLSAHTRKNTINTLYGQSRGAIYGGGAVSQPEQSRTLSEAAANRPATIAEKLAAAAVVDSETKHAQANPSAPAPRSNIYANRPGVSPYPKARKKKSKGDLFLVIAILVALIAIGAMLYGYYFSSDIPLTLNTNDTQVENVQPTPDGTEPAATETPTEPVKEN